jgi:6-hydroxycyclohex-1-ene-1-carbonyl-CoA dehydrogenase
MISWRMTGVKEPLERTETDIPSPGDGEVLLKVAGCGVCHTDLGFLYDGVPMRASLPLALGHEISGRVLETGKGAEEWAGKAVVVPAVMPCSDCDVCNRGFGNICAAQKMPGNDIQGGFASHIVVPANGLCEVPVDGSGKPKGAADISLEELSVVADALTTPYQAIIESGLTAEDTAIFVGVGGVGGFGAQIAKAFGATVIAIDVDTAKLEAIAPYVDTGFNAAAMDFKSLRKSVSGFVKERGKRRTEWKIFETSGTAAGQTTAFGLMPYGGYLGVVGFTLDKVTIRLSNLMAFHATVRGSWGCLPKYYPPVVDLVLQDKVKIGPFVETFPIDRINEIFEKVHNREIQVRPIMVP